MITVDSAGRIRLSLKVSRWAGFNPGQQLSVTVEGPNSFRIQPTTKSSRYSVELDGRIRVAKNFVGRLGVKTRGKNMVAGVCKGSIVVTM